MGMVFMGPGVDLFITSLLTLVIGFCLLFCTVVAGLVGGPDDERWYCRIWRRSKGPLVCLAIGGAALAISASGSRSLLADLDPWSLAVPELGLALAAATMIGAFAAASARRGVIIAAVVSILVGFAGYLLSAGEKNRLPEAAMIVLLPIASALTVRRLALRAMAAKSGVPTRPAS